MPPSISSPSLLSLYFLTDPRLGEWDIIASCISKDMISHGNLGSETSKWILNKQVDTSFIVGLLVHQGLSWPYTMGWGNHESRRKGNRICL